MPVAPSPHEISERAVDEGERRLDQSTPQLASASFIADFTVVFGIVAREVVHALVEPQFDGVAPIAGPLAFDLGAEVGDGVLAEVIAIVTAGSLAGERGLVAITTVEHAAGAEGST